MASADTLRTFGETLRAARIEQQRSLSDLASAIKINRRHLEAIEAGDLSQLPQGPYVTAFVREYARALGLTVPPEYAPVPASEPPSPRDPKVISHPVHPDEEGGGISQIARDTARLANTAVKGAVKTVTKTTESMVNLVETGGKEAFEVLTSKELWGEAENIRRERHGLPPLERAPEHPSPAMRPSKIETPPLEAPPAVPPSEEASLSTSIGNAASIAERAQKPLLGSEGPPAARTSRRATNTVIVLLAILFGGVAYLAIRMSRAPAGSSTIPNKDYVPAPITRQPIAQKPKAAVPAATTLPSTPTTIDSLRFELRATQPVWVSIAPDGVPAYRGQMRAGEVRSFRAARKFVVDIGNQKSVAMTLDGTRISRLPAIKNSNVVVRNLVLTRDQVSVGGNTIDLHKFTVSPAANPAPKNPAPASNSFRGVPPPAIYNRMEALARKARQEAQQRARTKHVYRAPNYRYPRGKKFGKNPALPSEPIQPVQPIPPSP